MDMALNDPREMAFERAYTAKFSALSAPSGVPLHYDQDIAALDLGIHLTADSLVTNSRVWFQLKGIHTATLPRADFDRSDDISYPVKIEHLRAWYQAPEAVYLVIYIESADLFLAEDIRDIVRRQWGDELLNDAMFTPNQETATVKVRKCARVDNAFWGRLLGHRSMRADGRMFRGRPLGHDLDPLRTTLNQMEPALFIDVVHDLLSEHGYRPGETLDAAILFPDAPAENGASLESGILHEKFEIVLQMTTELVPDGDDGFRIEGESDFAQGPCAVLIHSSIAARPSVQAMKSLAANLVSQRDITRLLVFVNASLQRSVVGFSGYTGGLGNSGLRCRPQHLEDISFNFLTTTNTYHRFRDKVSYWGQKLWTKEQGPLFILPPDGGRPMPLE
jgi:Domain of unknown function (DUF4365)